MGIFWRKLGFELENTVNVIDAAFRLHNFLVDYRLQNREEDEQWEKEDFQFFAQECSDFARLYPDEVVGTFGDNVNKESGVGVKEKHLQALTKLGVKVRNLIRNKLDREGLKRERGNFKRNRNNHVVGS